ncbi:hypothetical protein SPRG_00079 [Saprolegnia parasitica CBS 223.65]|uniref:Pherophorin domain-containing protein n=1 Tax=Saprolegnia parasitica (strain CBS 223.65) TaxID=695850 RepID=A0A067CX31_SAPPC|nr:hypothetical protein SPRG_00079 [Saprolegnia parasitica CBS 223.65]KDO35234.1 hypothetical protein SPRG_00079 [Saprolegnia parasitica CBS 223.65]|eukprot:XP_012193585.1 hypothetical protein SPRG_00079 [Saprolegnia parasitica CBS 223.65]
MGRLVAWLAALSATATTATTTVVPYPNESSSIEVLEYTTAQIDLQADQAADIATPFINLDYYEYNVINDKASPQYTISLLVDPCSSSGPGCCQDQFGTPAYVVPGSNINANGVASLLDEYGAPMAARVSRIGDFPSVFDPDCLVDAGGKVYRNTTVHAADGSLSFAIDYASTCVDLDFAIESSASQSFPACWDNNGSVNALSSCYTFDGRAKPHCVSVAYMQTAFIMQCMGGFALDNHCGTFLELHKPNDETILAQTRLFAELPNGYRTTTLPLFYKGNMSRTVCLGDYEIWWVLRTQYKFVVQYRKKLRVASPVCEFDLVTNAYRGYTTLNA